MEVEEDVGMEVVVDNVDVDATGEVAIGVEVVVFVEVVVVLIDVDVDVDIGAVSADALMDVVAVVLVDLDEQGRIKVDCSNHTSIPGVFAAGDVTNGYAEQVLIAVGEGAKAALSAYEYLLQMP